MKPSYPKDMRAVAKGVPAACLIVSGDKLELVGGFLVINRKKVGHVLILCPGRLESAELMEGDKV